MNLRKSIFWCHPLAGLMAGPVIAIMSATGIAIAFEEEILRWFDREASRLEGVYGEEKGPLSIAELTRKIEADKVGEKVSSIAMYSVPGRAWEVHLGDDGPFYLDPWTGSMRASQAHGAHEIIHKLEEWHRWLGAADGQTSIARMVTVVSNLALVVLCVTGLYLWFPRQWSWRALRPLLLLQTGFREGSRFQLAQRLRLLGVARCPVPGTHGSGHLVSKCSLGIAALGSRRGCGSASCTPVGRSGCPARSSHPWAPPHCSSLCGPALL